VISSYENRWDARVSSGLARVGHPTISFTEEIE
jgi:hypothetical protein